MASNILIAVLVTSLLTQNIGLRAVVAHCWLNDFPILLTDFPTLLLSMYGDGGCLLKFKLQVL